MQLTEHFTLDELVRSDTAVRKGINNTPPSGVVESLRRVAQILERARSIFGGNPILVSSGYRCLALNVEVGSTRTSAHLVGLAVDFTCPKFGSPLDICRRIEASDIPYDQLIYEGSWVHLGLSAVGIKPRREVLTAHFGGGATRYTPGFL